MLSLSTRLALPLHPPQQGAWTPEEDARMKQLQAELGNKWKEIGVRLGRHQESVNDRWNNLGKGLRAKSGGGPLGSCCCCDLML
jgi:hypothetical protein